jgi:RNA polymerase sigma-70 factor (ECF subfamily)
MSQGNPYRTEEEILEGLRNDSAGAFEALFDRFADLVYGFGLKVTGDDAAARDILRTALVNATRSAGNVKSPRSIERWLFREASNAFLAQRRQAGDPGDGEIPLVDLLPACAGGRNVPLHDWSLDADEQARRSEEKRHLREIVPSLPPSHALVLVLHDMEEMSPPEIADILQKPVSTVKTRLHHARLFLRRELSHRLQAGEQSDTGKVT